jgi:hypothetical protein
MTDEAPIARPDRRLQACVERWYDAYTGGFDPSCCRFPKSCSAGVYRDDIDESKLEGGDG